MVNRKRVQRLWREEGLRVRPYAQKRRRVGTSTVPSKRLRAERRNQVWALDFIFDSTSDGRPIKALAMCDEHTRLVKRAYKYFAQGCAALGRIDLDASRHRFHGYAVKRRPLGRRGFSRRRPPECAVQFEHLCSVQ